MTNRLPGVFCRQMIAIYNRNHADFTNPCGWQGRFSRELKGYADASHRVPDKTAVIQLCFFSFIYLSPKAGSSRQTSLEFLRAPVALPHASARITVRIRSPYP